MPGTGARLYPPFFGRGARANIAKGTARAPEGVGVRKYFVLLLLAAWLYAPPIPPRDACLKDLPEVCRNAGESVEERPWPPLPEHVCDKGGRWCGELWSMR